MRNESVTTYSLLAYDVDLFKPFFLFYLGILQLSLTGIESKSIRYGTRWIKYLKKVILQFYQVAGAQWHAK
jgi:hypothetical protein